MKILPQLCFATLLLAACSSEDATERTAGTAVTFRNSDPSRLYPDSVGAHPAEGFVPTDSTAAAIAFAVLDPVYENIRDEMPFEVSLYKDSIWIVEGTFRTEGEHRMGGVAYVEIRKSDGAVLKMTHGK